MDSIFVKDITKTYSNGTKALDNVSLNIKSGEFYGLIGVNGAGKTTLINTLTGQLNPDNGEVKVLDLNSKISGAEIRSKVGILPEKETPLSFMTPSEYFDFIGDVRGISDDEVQNKVNEWVERLDMKEEMNSMNRNLSRGQQQKVLFAGTFIHEPDVVFIDEPLANLDPLIQEKLKNYLKEYNEKGNTIVLSTHYLDVAIELCEKLGVMRDGKMIGEYKTDDINSDDDIRKLLTGDKNAK